MAYPPEPERGSDWSNPDDRWGSPDQGGYHDGTPPPPPPPPGQYADPHSGGQQHGGQQYGGPHYGAPGQQPPQSYIPAQPGIIPLRPLNLGQIYDGAFKSIRANPMVMFIFAGVILSVSTIVELVLSAPFFTGYMSILDLLDDDPAVIESMSADDFASMLTGSLGPMILGAVLSVIATTILTGVLTFAVSQAVLGYKPTVRQVWDQAKGQILRLIGLVVLIGLIGAAVPVAFVALFILVIQTGSTGLGIFVGLVGLLAAVVWFIVVNVGTAMATPALMLERCGPITALRRGWALAKPFFWRVLGIVLLTGIITSVVSSVIVMPFSMFSIFLPTAGMLAAQGVGTVIAATLITPFSAAVIALLYIDIRIRREGLAAELTAAAAR